MNSKKFITTTIGLIFIIGIFFLIVNFLFFNAPKTTLWINNCFIKKDNYARSINKKKIVFASGSNTLYGMETCLIENIFQIPTVNLAIHAGLKADYILYRAKKVLKNGDIAILPFEYQNYLWDGEEEEARTYYILTHDKNYFLTELDFYEKLSLLASIKPFEFIKTGKEHLSDLKEQEIGHGYTSVTLNKNGDETYKNGVTAKAYEPFQLKESFRETKGLKKILEFSKWCTDNNIKLFITFPNTINHTEYHKEPYTKYFEDLIKFFKQNNIDIIGKPTDFLYPKNYFYDTSYHMNLYGANVRTLDFMKIISENHLKYFGAKLTKENIEVHLTKLKTEREIWRKPHPQDVTKIEALKVH